VSSICTTPAARHLGRGASSSRWRTSSRLVTELVVPCELRRIELERDVQPSFDTVSVSTGVVVGGHAHLELAQPRIGAGDHGGDRLRAAADRLADGLHARVISADIRDREVTRRISPDDMRLIRETAKSSTAVMSALRT